jgi:hypothetical protein
MEFVIWVETRLAGKTLEVSQVASVERSASGIGERSIPGADDRGQCRAGCRKAISAASNPIACTTPTIIDARSQVIQLFSTRNGPLSTSTRPRAVVAPNSLSFQVVEPLKTHNICYDKNGFQLENEVVTRAPDIIIGFLVRQEIQA